MNNYSQASDPLTRTAPSGGVTAGVPVLIGSLLVVPIISALEAARFSCVASGVITPAPKTTGEAWTEGQKLYWKVSTSKFTSVATDGALAGTADLDAASDDTTGSVRLQGGAADLDEGTQTAVVVLTDSTGYSGTHDDTLSATTVPAALTGGESPTEAEHNAVLTLLAVMAQNASDTAQKILEIRTALVNAGIIAA